MPAYNCEDYIGASLDSILSQIYENWEVIVVDDCSTDNTSNIVKDYMQLDERILYFKLETNSGAAVARNKAIDLARGKYMAFLDSDDIWFPEKLLKQINFMEKNKSVFTCTSYTKIDSYGKDLNRTIVSQPKLDYEGLLKTCPGNSTVIYDVDVLGKFKIPDLKKRNDYVMWLQIIKKGKTLHGIIEPLGSHRIRSEGISNNKKSLVKYHWSIYRKIENMSLIKSTYLIFYWIFMTVLKLR